MRRSENSITAVPGRARLDPVTEHFANVLHAGALAASPVGNRTNNTFAEEIVKRVRNAHSSQDGCTRMFRTFSLRAGPRASRPAPNTPAAPHQLVDAVAHDNADFDRGGISCPAHSTANAHSLADAASAPLRPGMHHCNTALAASLVRTSSHNPSEYSVAVVDDAVP
jgi:hypothetical protein